MTTRIFNENCATVCSNVSHCNWCMSMISNELMLSNLEGFGVKSTHLFMISHYVKMIIHYVIIQGCIKIFLMHGTPDRHAHGFVKLFVLVAMKNGPSQSKSFICSSPSPYRGLWSLRLLHNTQEYRWSLVFSRCSCEILIRTVSQEIARNYR